MLIMITKNSNFERVIYIVNNQLIKKSHLMVCMCILKKSVDFIEKKKYLLFMKENEKTIERKKSNPNTILFSLNIIFFKRD